MCFGQCYCLEYVFRAGLVSPVGKVVAAPAAVSGANAAAAGGGGGRSGGGLPAAALRCQRLAAWTSGGIQQGQQQYRPSRLRQRKAGGRAGPGQSVQCGACSVVMIVKWAVTCVKFRYLLRIKTPKTEHPTEMSSYHHSHLLCYIINTRLVFIEEKLCTNFHFKCTPICQEWCYIRCFLSSGSG